MNQLKLTFPNKQITNLMKIERHILSNFVKSGAKKNWANQRNNQTRQRSNKICGIGKQQRNDYMRR